MDLSPLPGHELIREADRLMRIGLSRLRALALQRPHPATGQFRARRGMRHLIDPARLGEFFAAIESQLYRYPAVDPRTFRKAVERTRLELSAGS